MGEIYFDNSSTTKVCSGSAEKIAEMLTVNYGNPSSLHTLGFRAEREMTSAREKIASVVSAQPEEIFFTSGGTESNNMAIFGAAKSGAKRGRHIVTTMVEHPSILNGMKRLEQDGFSVTYIEPDKNGNISPEKIAGAVTPDTILVSIMLVNNEVGSIMPVDAAADAIRRKKAPALLHVDAVQAFGKLPISVKKIGADLMSMSSHKIHGPKGSGALYLRKGVHITPITYGGGQEKNVRPGTESTPLIAGFGAAAAALPDIGDEYKKMLSLNAYCREKLLGITGIKINSPENALPYILNFSMGKVRAETMLHYLSQREIYVSSGSACSKGKKSYVLTAMGLDGKVIDSSLRLSFSRYNTKGEVDVFISALKEGLSHIAHM